MIWDSSEKPLVSCIIIFLNGEQYIRESIASIFAQTYPHWELLLVDDGSTDQSTVIAKEYARQYPQQVYYLDHPDHENRGMSAARNLGINHAQGKYIGFLDADDIWLPEKLAQQVAILESESEAAMVYGRTEIWYSWTGNPEDGKRDRFYDLGVKANTLVQPPTLFLLLLQNKCQTPTTCNALIRREVFTEIGKFEESFRTMYEDQVFFSKVLVQSPIYVSDQVWAKYRQHSESCSEQKEHKQYHQTRLRFLQWLNNYLLAKGIKDANIWQGFRQELWSCQYPLAVSLWHRLLSRIRLTRSQIIGFLKMILQRRLIQLSMNQITDEFGFSLADDGWNSYYSLLKEFSNNPDISLEETTFFQFFNHPEINTIESLEDLLWIHQREEPSELTGFKFYLGTWPWGGITSEESEVGGTPFGWYYDQVEGKMTKELWEYGRNLWYQPDDRYTLEVEWNLTLEILRILQKGYHPLWHLSYPEVTLLVRQNGEKKALMGDGHHRLAVLSFLGFEKVAVNVRQIVLETEVENWYYVKNGLCSREKALQIFHAFFNINGRERANYLGLKHSINNHKN